MEPRTPGWDRLDRVHALAVETDRIAEWVRAQCERAERGERVDLGLMHSEVARARQLASEAQCISAESRREVEARCAMARQPGRLRAFLRGAASVLDLSGGSRTSRRRGPADRG